MRAILSAFAGDPQRLIGADRDIRTHARPFQPPIPDRVVVSDGYAQMEAAWDVEKFRRQHDTRRLLAHDFRATDRLERVSGDLRGADRTAAGEHEDRALEHRLH